MVGKIKDDIKCLINGCNKGSFYLDYETDMFIFFVEKYSNIVYEYSEEIFLVYVKYFKNLCELYSKNTYIDNDHFYLKNLHRRFASKEKIYDLFGFLFKNKKNTIDRTNIEFFSSAISGHDIIKCYICLGGNFNEIETNMMMTSIAKNPIWDLSDSLISIINNNDVFSYNDHLLEYASYIGINNYIKRYILKNHGDCYLSKKCLYNIMMYSNDVDLCNMLIDHFNNDHLEFACKSQNINIISLILNSKIMPNKKLFESILKQNDDLDKFNENLAHRLKIFDIDDEKEYFLYHEFDKFNLDGKSLLIRKIKKEEYYSIQEIITMFEKYGYRYNYTFFDYLLAVKNKILIDPCNFNNESEICIREFLDACASNSFYPFFQDKRYPKPDIKCLYIECGKKSNTKVIKLLTEHLIVPDVKCLEIACSIGDNSVIKYFVEKKNISPNLGCIKNNLKLYCEFEDSIDINGIFNLIINYGGDMTKYLHQKFQWYVL